MMNLSTKGRYATRIVVYLATLEPGYRARKQEIAEYEGISPDYVEQILLRLKEERLVQSFRGARGGFTLGTEATGVTVADVLQAVEGSIAVAPCLDEPCGRATACVTQAVWQQATEALMGVFANVTIAELAEEVLVKRNEGVHAYDI
jgi:Rrf2 family protein